MAREFNIPSLIGGDLEAIKRWIRNAAGQLNDFIQSQSQGAFHVFNREVLIVPTSTTISGAEEIVFESPHTGKGTLIITGVGFDTGINIALNGVNLGTLSNADTTSEIIYEVQVTNLKNVDGELNSFKIWSTTADSGELRRLEVWRYSTQSTTTSYTANDTWTKPANLSFIVVECIGGGGGGGDAANTIAGEYSAGGGGGAGAYANIVIPASDLVATETITVGAAGTAGSTGTGSGDGGVGGDSSFGSHCVAKGGGGGILGLASSTDGQSGGGIGGLATGSTGDVVNNGGTGGPGLRMVSASFAISGAGGISYMGGGGQIRPAGSFVAAAAGDAGDAQGSGGSGCARGPSSSGGADGGVGKGGIVIVTEHLNT